MEQDNQILMDQVKLLQDYNKDNIKNEPEQVRKNAETIAVLLRQTLTEENYLPYHCKPLKN